MLYFTVHENLPKRRRVDTADVCRCAGVSWRYCVVSVPHPSTQCLLADMLTWSLVVPVVRAQHIHDEKIMESRLASAATAVTAAAVVGHTDKRWPYARGISTWCERDHKPRKIAQRVRVCVDLYAD